MRQNVVLLLVVEVRGWWLHPKYKLESKPQMLDALQFAQPHCPFGLVLDVGANGGRETEQARSMGYNVIAVECHQKEYIKLSEKWRRDSHITLLNGCASDQLSLQRFSQAGTGSSLHPEAVSQAIGLDAFKLTRQTVTNVITFPMDPLIEKRPDPQQPVCVVKIDTQGHEISVMRGVERTLKKHRPVVIFELDYRFVPQVDLTSTWMAALGYDCAVPTPGKGPGRHCSVCNVLCMPERSMWNTTRAPRQRDTSREGRRLEADSFQESVPICTGHRWLWYGSGGESCSAPAAASLPRRLAHNSRSVYVASLSYGGTDQITVSTVHLARELNVINTQGAPFVHVLPVARDLEGTSSARTEALALFPEEHRPHVELGDLFDVKATIRCSSARVIVGGLVAVAAEERMRPGQEWPPTTIRMHLVVASKHYFGPLLSHTEPKRVLALINRSAVTPDSRYGRPFDIVNFVRNRLAEYSRRVAHFDKSDAGRGIKLKAARLTLLPDVAKPTRKDIHSRQPWARLQCSPDSSQASAWCGATFLSHVAEHEPDGSMLLFISDVSAQDDFPSVDVLRHFWRPPAISTSTAGAAPYLARMRNDEQAVTECFKLAPRFDEAADRLMARNGRTASETLAWQLRTEKISLLFHKRGVKWFAEFKRSLLRQAELVSASARACGHVAILFESDLVGPGSTTMWETIFTRHIKVGLEPRKMYGVDALNESTIGALHSELLSAVLSKLRGGRRRGSKTRQIEVLTTPNLLNISIDRTRSDGALEPFIAGQMKFSPSNPPPLKLERALLSVTMLARAGALVRSPTSSTFSGWANAIRLASNGREAAAWATEDGGRWWRCYRPNGVKLGKCKKEDAGKDGVFDQPQLCKSQKSASVGRRMARAASPGCARATPAHEVTSAALPAAPVDASDDWWISSLVREQLRPIASNETYSALERRVPFETVVTSEQLSWEYQETLAFEGKQLKRDPRLKPSGIRVMLAHLKECTECHARDEVRKAMHGTELIDIDSGPQLLVDDHPIHSWRNVLRFLNTPANQRIVLRPPSNSSSAARFGCPCSVVRGAANPGASGKFQLLHAAGTVAGPEHRYKEWPSAYSLSSADGLSKWHRSRKITLDSFSHGVTGSFTASAQRGSFVAGYEGANSKACLAHSTDGRHWTTVATGGLPILGSIPAEQVRDAHDPHQLAPLPKATRERPKHLTKSKVKIHLRQAPYKFDCGADILRCLDGGATWGGGLVWTCIQEAFMNGSITRKCGEAIEPKMHPLLSDCVDGSRSALGRAGDCNVQPVFDVRRQRQLVWYRQDFGTPGGWREIRGVQVVELNGTLDKPSQSLLQPTRKLSSYYLDRLGKLERFRRQVYSVTLTPYSHDLWLGLMTVIEWAKDLAEPAGKDLPAFQRDTSNIYLVTSRDGVHVDPEWVYARRPLIPKGTKQANWNAGFVLAANHIVESDDRSESRIYYEARRNRHEERFGEPGVIGMATWRLDTLVGLRAADPSAGPAQIVTKPFQVASGEMIVLLNVDTTDDACEGGMGSSVVVEVLNEGPARPDDRVPPVSAPWTATVGAGNVGTAVAVQWKTNVSTLGTSVPVTSGSTIRLLFTISGSARLYSFQVDAAGR